MPNKANLTGELGLQDILTVLLMESAYGPCSDFTVYTFSTRLQCEQCVKWESLNRRYSHDGAGMAHRHEKGKKGERRLWEI